MEEILRKLYDILKRFIDNDKKLTLGSIIVEGMKKMYIGGDTIIYFKYNKEWTPYLVETPTGNIKIIDKCPVCGHTVYRWL